MTGGARTLLLAMAGAFAWTSIVAVHAPSDDPMRRITHTCTGVMTLADRGRMLECVFTAPAGVRQVDVDVHFSSVERPTHLDLGLRSPIGLRGWSQDRHDHIHIDDRSASYGYVPGPIEQGRWALLINVTNISHEKVRYEATIRLSSSSDPEPAILSTAGGWYAGDLHVHSGHSDGYRRLAD